MRKQVSRFGVGSARSWRRFFLSAALLVLFILPGSVTGDAPQKQVPAPRKQPSTPRAVPSDVQAACDAAHVTAAKTPGASVKRSTGTFNDETLRQPVFGCGLAVSGSFDKARETGDAVTRLRQSFSARGWQEMPAYSADGADGTSFAFRKSGVACLARGTWDSGAAGDPEIPPRDWYKVVVFCTSPVFPEERQR